MKVILKTDVVVIEAKIENEIKTEIEIILRAGTEVTLDPATSIAWAELPNSLTTVIPFDIFPSEYSALN